MRSLHRYLANLAVFAAANAIIIFLLFRLGASPQVLAGIQGMGMLLGSLSPTLTERILGNGPLMTKVRATSPRYALPSWARFAEQTVFGVIGLALLLWATWAR